MKTYRELIVQLDQLMREIDIAREREARLITERVLELLSERGVDVRDLIGASAHVRRVPRPLKPKYWNPETRETWTGRGRMPRWMAGKNPEDFRIPEDWPGNDIGTAPL